MKGKFCIYECSQNKWLMFNNSWENDRDYRNELIPTYHTLRKFVNQRLETEYELMSTNYRNVVVCDMGQVNKNYLLTFDTMREAEEFLLKTALSTDNGQFYSIRKVYF